MTKQVEWNRRYRAKLKAERDELRSSLAETVEGPAGAVVLREWFGRTVDEAAHWLVSMNEHEAGGVKARAKELSTLNGDDVDRLFRAHVFTLLRAGR